MRRKALCARFRAILVLGAFDGPGARRCGETMVRLPSRRYGMVMISEIVAPVSAPQALPAWQANRWTAQIVAALREQAGQPVPVWRLLDRLARTRNPRDRGHLRFFRLMY